MCRYRRINELTKTTKTSDVREYIGPTRHLHYVGRTNKLQLLINHTILTLIIIEKESR